MSLIFSARDCGIFRFFLLENPHAHKFLVLGGGGVWKGGGLGRGGGLEGGGLEVPILFLWAWRFFLKLQSA